MNGTCNSNKALWSWRTLHSLWHGRQWSPNIGCYDMCQSDAKFLTFVKLTHFAITGVTDAIILCPWFLVDNIWIGEWTVSLDIFTQDNDIWISVSVLFFQSTLNQDMDLSKPRMFTTRCPSTVMMLGKKFCTRKVLFMEPSWISNTFMDTFQQICKRPLFDDILTILMWETNWHIPVSVSVLFPGYIQLKFGFVLQSAMIQTINKYCYDNRVKLGWRSRPTQMKNIPDWQHSSLTPWINNVTLPRQSKWVQAAGFIYSCNCETNCTGWPTRFFRVSPCDAGFLQMRLSSLQQSEAFSPVTIISWWTGYHYVYWHDNRIEDKSSRRLYS